MKNSKLLMLLIGTILIGSVAIAQTDSSASLIYEQPGLEKEYIIYLNLTNPLFYKKAGAGLSIRNLSMDMYIYADYRYGSGNSVWVTNGERTYYGGDNSNGWEKIGGGDIGIQIRFRDRELQKPYAPYLKNLRKATRLYHGPYFETEFIAGKTNIDLYAWRENSYTEIAAYHMKLGYLFGLNFDFEKILFDLHFGLGTGYSIVGGTYFLKDGNTETISHHSMNFNILFGVLVGYKL